MDDAQDDLLPFARVADEMGLSRGTVRKWYLDGKMPEPDGYFGGARWPVWRRGTIAGWRTSAEVAEMISLSLRHARMIREAAVRRISMGYLDRTRSGADLPIS